MKKNQKRINITAGEILNKYLSNKQVGIFIPFNEDLSTGNITYPLFGNAFITARYQSLAVTKKLYLSKLDPILQFIANKKQYEEVVLWFGNEPFCQINLLGVLTLLEQIQFKGTIFLYVVDETKDNVVMKEYENIQLGKFAQKYITFIQDASLKKNYQLF